MPCLTRENCLEILQKYSQDELCDPKFSYCIKPSEKHNILKLKLSPEISNKCAQFFVKTLHCNPTPSALLAANGNSNKEVSFYQCMDHICENIKATESVIPHVYFADVKNNTLVLEDLAKIGYKKCCTRQFDEDHIKVALASLAKFHSLSIVHDQKLTRLIDGEVSNFTDESIFADITDELLKIFMRNLAKEVEGASENYECKLHTEYKRMLEDLSGVTPGLNVCCHGDLFSDNILYQYGENGAPTNCKFIDFASARYKPPAHDLTMLLCKSVSPKLLKANYNHFLKYYYTNLQEILQDSGLEIEEILPLHQYELSCKKYMRYARMIVALNRVIHSSNQDPKDRCKNHIKKYSIQSDLCTAIANTILSIEDIHTIVQTKINTTDYDLKDYTLKPVDVKSGFLGEHMDLIVRIHTSKGMEQTLKYFVKSLPEMESQRDFAIESGSIFKETSWFRRLLPEYIKNGIDIMQKCVPRCYLARDNDVFVFEDLKEAGYGMISVRTSLDLDEIKKAIASLAIFHAATLILEELKSNKLGRQYRLTEDYAKEFEETFYSNNKQCESLKAAIKASTPTYVNLLPTPKESTTTKEEIISMERKFVNEFYDDVQPSTEFRNSICHGDLWTANIMFRKQKGIVNKAMLIDFQSYRYSPPAQDLLAMIYLTTDRAIRKEHMTYLTSYYYEQLGKNMAEYNLDIDHIISREEFQKSLDHYEKFAVAQATTHKQIVTMSEETMQRFFQDKEWCRTCLFEDRTDTLIRCCNEDPVYRKIQEGTLADLWQLCEKLKRRG